jgi:alpha-N-arabinofuranosidase
MERNGKASTDIIRSALAGILLSASTAASAAPAIVARIDAGKTHDPISRYLYGMFIEPIGPLVARSLWAEMLDDRKFYFPVQSADRDPPSPPTQPGRPSRALRKWRPVGGGEAIAMDTSDPYVGKQDVAIALDPAMARGISQAGLGVAKGKRYVGHAQLSGEGQAKVQAILVWGAGQADRQVIDLPPPAAGWHEVSFAFTPGADTADARFDLVASGSGRLRIGVVSLMPADNIDGWRADTTAIARSLHSGFWRLPGGNFLSDWDWHEAIGPRDKRPPMFDEAWRAMQPNDFGMDEWINLTRILGTEPYVTVNAGLGDENSAAEEVEYLNGPASSEWGAKRAANGHPEPYHIKFWNIGNEPYGAWQIGVTTLDYYTLKHRRFAARMLGVDPGITILASGAMPDQEKNTQVKQNLSPETAAERYGTDEDWTGGLLAKAGGTFQGITEHWYDHEEARPEAPAADELIESTRQPSNHVRMKAIEWQHYRQAFPIVDKNKIFLSIDEYAATGTPNLKKTLAYGMVMNEMLRHTDFLKMSAFTTGTATMDITPTDSTLNAVGLVFKLYGEHLGEGMIPLDVDGDSPQPDPKYPVGFSHPKVKAGSPTYPLDITAALAPDRRSLTIAVVNPTTTPQSVAIDLRAMRASGAGRAWRLTGASLDAQNKAGSPPGVTIQELSLPALGRTLTAAPLSTTIYRFPVKTQTRP